MKKEISPATRSKLKQLQRQFEKWRQSREKGSPIPEKLLDKAARLTKDYSIHQVSRSLQINHTVLKKRAEEIEKTPGITSDFIEIKATDILSPLPVGCIVEIEKADGTKMKMHFGNRVDINLIELGKAFWRNGR